MLSVKGLPFSHRHRRQEFVEVRKGIVWSRCGLGMVLHGKQRKLSMTNALDGAVVEVQMRDHKIGRTRHLFLVSNHCKSMVLRRDEHLIRAKISYRMIATPVPIRKFGRSSAIREPDELMSEADTERRQA